LRPSINAVEDEAVVAQVPRGVSEEPVGDETVTTHRG
jgi:hypothetical protein